MPFTPEDLTEIEGHVLINFSEHGGAFFSDLLTETRSYSPELTPSGLGSALSNLQRHGLVTQESDKSYGLTSRGLTFVDREDF